MTWPEVANAVASGTVAVCSVVFVVTYATLAPWRSSEAGRHVMAFSAAVGALGAYTVAVTVWHDGVVAMVLRVVRVLLVLALAGLLVQRTVMVIRAQRRR